MPDIADRFIKRLALSEFCRRLDVAGQLQAVVPAAALAAENAALAAAGGLGAAVLPATGDGLLLGDAFPGHLSYDSRDVVPGSLFFCKGARFDSAFLVAALELGALAYVSETAYPVGGIGIIVRDVRKAMAMAAAWYYEGLLDRLKLIGVTGTKGKSTTVYFIRAVLDAWMAELGQPNTAFLSSIDNYDGVKSDESHLTTQESFELYRRFAHAVSQGIGYLSMEVSSQALKYDRTYGIDFDVSCFLNFGRDHISDIEHPSLDDYLASKLRIFAQSRTACVNLGSAELPQVLKAAAAADQVVSFGLGADCRADVWASEVRPQGLGTAFVASVFGSVIELQLGLIGRFNVEDALAAVAVTSVLGVPASAIQSGLATARVPGRMELFRAPGNKTVIVDYAHNQMSFEALFSAVQQEFPESSISVVFGCPGLKAHDRRSDLGRIAAVQATDIVLTEEDPGEEPPEAICLDIARHVVRAGGRPRIIIDREEAIISSIQNAPEKAVVLVTGKGRETRQKRGREYVEVLSDVDIVQRYIGAGQ
ncbi:MAG: UDP-N-acetylmuramoyl-L-alanyl-D-glutamate--2,6-diaminopimelate ligase [Actinomycetia bacterium]|nr:UDP-N-acetylmuramoyl-L-alanyl-D-glutamate--2,6-diaminopimelate ligase [Actinomycetes bacterium]